MPFLPLNKECGCRNIIYNREKIMEGTIKNIQRVFYNSTFLTIVNASLGELASLGLWVSWEVVVDCVLIQLFSCYFIVYGDGISTTVIFSPNNFLSTVLDWEQFSLTDLWETGLYHTFVQYHPWTAYYIRESPLVVF